MIANGHPDAEFYQLDKLIYLYICAIDRQRKGVQSQAVAIRMAVWGDNEGFQSFIGS
jgi:hypothetical protein